MVVGQAALGIGLEGWDLLVAVAGVALTALGIGYSIGRHRREDAVRRAALRPALDVSIEERAALASPPGAGKIVPRYRYFSLED